jgi:GTPase
VFRDEATIEVVAGRGGDGLVSFHREKFITNGGPDGGDGGRGGSVILRATVQRNSLLEVGRKFRYAAPKGRPGGPNKRYGACGSDIVVEVPVGTQVFDAEMGNLLRDLDSEGAEVVAAKGGHGGKGNVHFKNSVRQTPRMATDGGTGEARRLRLELKLFAEVGLLGFPNAGKSTFLARVTAARPKVADYPFTTLDPQVGICEVGNYDTLVLADLPGLIEGAAEGHGLGHRFLRHVERCKVLLHLVDVSAGAERDPVEAWRALEAELANYSAELAAKPRILVATKHHEDEGSQERVDALAEAAGCPVLGISSVLGLGIAELLRAAHKLVRPEAE